MQNYRPTATAEPPSLGNTATEAFRIADIKLEARSFLDDLGKLVTEASATVTVATAVDATDLRLKTLEEAIQTATVAPSEDEEISSDSEQAGPSNPAQNNGVSPAPQQQRQQSEEQPVDSHPTAGPTPHDAAATAAATAVARGGTQPGTSVLPGELTKDQIEKQKIIDAYNAAVAAVKLKYEQERATAAWHLHTLQSYPLEGDKLTRRSFADVKSLESVEVAPEAPVETGRGSTRGRTAATAAATTAATAAAVPAGEVVVRVAIHLPQAPAYVSEEWLVLGSQSLTQLRDSLYCLTEANIKNTEEAENAKRPANAPVSLHQPSSYFYIEGSFFVDTRHISSTGPSSSDVVDLSEGIRKYLKQVNVRAPPHPLPGPASRPLGPFTTEYSVASMQDRVFEDLWVRLGSGAAGLFCHQGGCEHLIVFLDVRTHDPAVDPPLIGQYPFKVADPGSSVRRKRECEACGFRFARKVTYEDRSAPHTPYFWCDECYAAMHYDDSGSALYTDFRVFPYEADYNQMILHEKSTIGGIIGGGLRREPAAMGAADDVVGRPI